MADFILDTDRYFSKSSEYFHQKEYDRAILSAHLSRNGDSDDVIYLNIGMIYCMKGEYLKAVKNYAISLAMNPKSEKAWNGSGFCWFTLGKYEEAILKFKKAVEVDSKYTQSYLNWGLSLYCLKEEAEGAQIIEEALKKSSLSKETIIERYELQLSSAEERLAEATNEEAKALLKEQINGYQWILEFVSKKMEELEKVDSENNDW